MCACGCFFQWSSAETSVALADETKQGCPSWSPPSKHIPVGELKKSSVLLGLECLLSNTDNLSALKMEDVKDTRPVFLSVSVFTLCFFSSVHFLSLQAAALRRVQVARVFDVYRMLDVLQELRSSGAQEVGAWAPVITACLIPINHLMGCEYVERQILKQFPPIILINNPQAGSFS